MSEIWPVVKTRTLSFSEALLQIAIIMSSVDILSQSRAIFGVAIAAACLGTLLCLNGFFLFFHLPFLSH